MVISQVEGDEITWTMQSDGPVERPADVVLGGRSVGLLPDPRSGPVAHLGVTLCLRAPSQHLLMDVYVHKDLANGARAQTLSLTRTPGEADPTANWFDRLCYDPTMVALGRGAVPPVSPAYPRMGELASHLFTRVGWDLAEFELWRMELPYPTPGTFYSWAMHPRR